MKGEVVSILLKFLKFNELKIFLFSECESKNKYQKATIR